MRRVGIGSMLVGALFAIGASAGWGATATATMTISAAVAGACTVVASPVAFGNSLPNAISANVDAQGAVTASCANGTPYSIGLNPGIGAGATLTARRMRAQGTTATLVYALYTDAARTTIWGDGSAGTAVVGKTATGSNQQTTVYGRIPAGQNPINGNYFDTVTVTVTF